MGIQVVPDWMAELEEEDVAFLKNFLLCSGSLKEIAGLYGVTYPTVRLRLDKIIQKVRLDVYKRQAPNRQEAPGWRRYTAAVQRR